MADKPDITPPISGGGKTAPVLSNSASAHAPFLYFEEASAMSHLNGVIRITLEAGRVIPSADGRVDIDKVMVAHLRMNIPAALSLKSAIEGALLLATPSQTEAKN